MTFPLLSLTDIVLVNIVAVLTPSIFRSLARYSHVTSVGRASFVNSSVTVNVPLLVYPSPPAKVMVVPAELIPSSGIW